TASDSLVAMKERCRVSLRLVADAGVDPAEVTALVGLGPTEVLYPSQSHVWELTLIGPSPVNAVRVANDLARDLIARVGADTPSREMWTAMRRALKSEVRFEFNFDRLINFSYELDRDVVRGLANLGALVSFHHYDSFHDRTPME